MGEAGAFLVGAVVLAAAAVVTLVVVRAAASGRLRPNHIAGMRTSATLSSPEAWQSGHVAARPWSDAAAVAAIVPAAAGAVAAIAGSAAWASGLVLAGALLLLAGVAAGGVVAHRVARDVRARA